MDYKIMGNENHKSGYTNVKPFSFLLIYCLLIIYSSQAYSTNQYQIKNTASWYLWNENKEKEGANTPFFFACTIPYCLNLC